MVMMLYHGGSILTYHGGGMLAPPRFNSYGSRRPEPVTAYGLPAVHLYHGSGFNLGKWFKKAGHSIVHWVNKAGHTVGAFAKKEGPAVLHVLENAGKGAARALGAAVPALMSGNIPLAAVALAGGAVQGAINGGGFGSRARASKRARHY